jgi:hypothetical protein
MTINPKQFEDHTYSGISVHGSSQSGLKEISPMMSDGTKGAGYTDKPSVFMWDPKKLDGPGQIGGLASKYASGGSFYITDAQKAGRLKDLPHVLHSSKPVKVLEEIPFTGKMSDFDAIDSALERHGLPRRKPEPEFLETEGESWS